MEMPPEANNTVEFESYRVLARFVLRMLIMGLFAGFSDLGFGKTLSGMLALAVLYCLFAAAIRRELLFDPVLTHFDEAAAYAAVACAASWVS